MAKKSLMLIDSAVCSIKHLDNNICLNYTVIVSCVCVCVYVYSLSTLNLMRRSDGRSSEVGKEIEHDKRAKSEINTYCIVYILLCNNIIYELL